jgi:hypothetical protein
MNPEARTPASATTWPQRWQRFSAAAVRGFHAYANWLVSISWKRFIVLAVLLIVAMAILHDLPPFTWTVTEHTEPTVRIIKQRQPMAPPAPPAPAVRPEPSNKPSSASQAPEEKRPGVHIDIPKDIKDGETTGLDISIGKDGVRITAKTDKPSAARQRPGGSRRSRTRRRCGRLGGRRHAHQPARPAPRPTPCARPSPRRGARCRTPCARRAATRNRPRATPNKPAATPSRPSKTSPKTCAGPASAPRASASAIS